MKELIVIKQLPIIEQQLKPISEAIDKKIDEISKLEVNENTVKEVKKVKSEFKKDFIELEEKRKQVKKAILNPYEQFEEVYKNYVTSKFTKADSDLKAKIDLIEQGLKDKKENELKDYFEEYKKANNIDFVNYEQLNIKVNLSDSLKSLKEQVKIFIDQRVNDLKLINTLDHKAEILVEYKQNLNANISITNVNERFKAIEEEKLKIEKEKELEKVIVDIAKESDKYNEILEKPEEVIEEKEYTLRFTVRATKIKLQELKKFLKNGGYIYE